MSSSPWRMGKPPTLSTFDVRTDGKISRIAGRGASDAASRFFEAEAKAGRFPAECVINGKPFRNHLAEARNAS